MPEIVSSMKNSDLVKGLHRNRTVATLSNLNHHVRFDGQQDINRLRTKVSLIDISTKNLNKGSKHFSHGL